jgi:hypothetical protein
MIITLSGHLTAKVSVCRTTAAIPAATLVPYRFPGCGWVVDCLRGGARECFGDEVDQCLRNHSLFSHEANTVIQSQPPTPDTSSRHQQLVITSSPKRLPLSVRLQRPRDHGSRGL